MIIYVERKTPIVKLNLKLQFQIQVYVIIVMQICLLKDITVVRERGNNIARASIFNIIQL